VTGLHAWIDASAGIAGDMLLGALVDAGADLAAVRNAVQAVIPDSVRISAAAVTRAGQRATKIETEPVPTDLPHRRWADINAMLRTADLAEPVRDRALRTFERLAVAEGRVHGIAPDDVHFHEVGALDSIADIVGVAAALHALEVGTLSSSAVAVGSGRISTAHGDLPVPVPAVVELSTGWQLLSGGPGELTTPTGMALIATLCERGEDLPAMTLVTSGAGAGTKDSPGRPNLTRVLIGRRAEAGDDSAESAVVLEANIDDFDPRLWPSVLTSLIAAGAADAWLVPIIMKKGRPAHTLAVLVRPDQAAALRSMIIEQTSTIGVRETRVSRAALPRGWVDVEVAYGTVAVKIAHRDGRIRQAMPEFDDLDRLAAANGVPVQRVLDQCRTALLAAGLVPGGEIPEHLRPHQ
jgi:pyridinium-3,5-bisthiocarboxylic acid mononucleotide nickel chelatase